MARAERRTDVLRLLLALVVLGGAYLGLCAWSAQHVPANASVGGIQIGGMSPEQARAAIDKGSRSVLATPIAVTVPGDDASFEVVPAKAGLAIDTERSLEGLTGFTLNPATVWDKLTGSYDAPLLTRTDDDALTAYLTGLAPKVATAAKEGTLTFPQGRITINLPVPGRTLDIAATKLALRRAFPADTTARAAVRETPPRISAEVIQQAASGFGAKAMSGPVTITSGTTTVRISPAEFAPALSVVHDGSGGLTPKYDEKMLAALVAKRVQVVTKPARDARWVFEKGRPKLVPSVDGSAVDGAALTKQVIAAITSDNRTVTVVPVVAKPTFTTAEAQKAGVRSMIVEFRSPFPSGDPTRTNNLVVASRTINGTYIPPGGTFSLNKILGERTTAKGYQDGTVIINGRLTRGTGGGVSQVSTVVYNLAYFAGVDFLEFSPHAFFIPRYPEGREATVYWPYLDNRWKNDTSYGMLLQTWVADGYVHGRVWSTKVWDIKSVKSPRRNIVEPETIRDDSPTCYPQQPQPGFDVTVTRQWYRPGSSSLVKSEPVTTNYIPEDEIICTDPDAKP
jgi:vancomycin resistance protein YoaR